MTSLFDRLIGAWELVSYRPIAEDQSATYPLGPGLVDDNKFWYCVIMIRTQISLAKDEYAAAKREAARLGISFAELLRRCLRSALPVNDTSPWMRYAGMVETGDPKASQHIDDVVYGGKD